MRGLLLLLLCATSATTSLAKLNAGEPRLAFAPKKPKIEAKNLKDLPPDHAALSIRGGACDDTNAAIFGKIGASAVLQTAGLMGVLAIGKAASPNVTKLLEKINLSSGVFGVSPAQWFSFLVVIFGSSFVGTFVDGGASAALNQALEPNVVAGDPNWYADLAKPAWNPPGWIFPIMWLIVSKPTQLAAVARLWNACDGSERGWKLLAYCFHLSLGDAWNKVFFGYQCVGRGVVVISAFLAMLFASTGLFWSVDPVAGKLMLPTCGWVLVAAALQWSIYFLNPPESA